MPEGETIECLCPLRFVMLSERSESKDLRLSSAAESNRSISQRHLTSKRLNKFSRSLA